MRENAETCARKAILTCPLDRRLRPRTRLGDGATGWPTLKDAVASPVAALLACRVGSSVLNTSQRLASLVSSASSHTCKNAEAPTRTSQ